MMTAGSTAATGQGLVMEVACTSRKVVPKRQQPGRPAIFGVRVPLFESQLLEVIPALLRKSRPRPESMRGVLQSHLKAPSSQRRALSGTAPYPTDSRAVKTDPCVCQGRNSRTTALIGTTEPDERKPPSRCKTSSCSRAHKT